MVFNRTLLFSLFIGHATAQGMGSIASTSAAPVSLGPVTPAPSNIATSSTVQPMGVNPSTVSPKGGVGSAQPVTVAPSSRPTGLTSGTLSPSIVSSVPVVDTLAPITSTPTAIDSASPVTLPPVSPIPSSTSPVSAAPVTLKPVEDTKLPTSLPTVLTKSPSHTFSPSGAPSESPTNAPQGCEIGCPDAPSIENGFSTLEALSCQIQYDWSQVLQGLPVQVPPTYRLCPNTVYNVTTAAIPILLSNTILLCGENGDLSEKCTVSGGETGHFIVRDLESVSIQGITFQTDGTEVSVFHEGGSLNLQDCQWTGSGRALTSRSATLTRLSDCSIVESNLNATAAIVAHSQSILEMERLQVQSTVSSESLIRIDNSTITITECDLSDNIAESLVHARGTSNMVMNDTTIKDNRINNGVFVEEILDVSMNGCVVTGNIFKMTLLSFSTTDGTSVISNSRVYNNTGGYSVASMLTGPTRFDAVDFNTNVAQIGIEVFSDVVMDSITWNTSQAEWHLYVRPGGSLIIDGDSIISSNVATVGLVYLENKAYCEIRNTKVASNNVTEFHLMSVLESSELRLADSTITDNVIANTAVFTYSSSQVLANKVNFTGNTIGKSLLRLTTNSTMSATFSDVSTNENSDDLVVVDSDSTLSVMGSNFTSNSVTSSLLVLRSNGTAICEQISFTKNKGETADAGMLQSLEGSTLSLKRVDAISNTFDKFAISSGESTLTSRYVFVKGHTGLSQNKFTQWEVFSITNQSALTLSDSSINATEAYIYVHVSNQSSAGIDGLQIEGQTTGADQNFGIMGEINSDIDLSDVCFVGGEYTYPVTSSKGTFSYSDVAGTNLVTTNSVNCSSMYVETSCIEFEGQSCGPIVTPAPAPYLTPVPMPTRTRSPTPAPTSPTSGAKPLLSMCVFATVSAIVMLFM